MSEIKHIEYVGFTFNGVHSSSLGIIRTSDGSRFNENLLPVSQDKTVQVPGGDGTYYFGSYYTQRQFNISYAFDSLTEEQLTRIKEVFGDKKVHELIFDEAPYKAYRAKVTGTATIKHIPFGEGATNRVYKGEGTIQFTAYDPYAHSVNKYLDQYVTYLCPAITVEVDRDSGWASIPWDESKVPIPGKKYVINYGGIEIIDTACFEESTSTIYFGNEMASVEYYLEDGEVGIFGKPGDTVTISIQEFDEYNSQKEWKDAAGLLSTQGNFDKLNDNKIPIYNPGVKETDFVLTLNFNSTDYIPSGSITVDSDSLSFNQIIRQDEDDQVKIDTKLNLIEGYKNGKKTGHIYNQYIKSGTFFKIPVSRISSGNGIKEMVLDSDVSSRFGALDYYYIYL